MDTVSCRAFPFLEAVARGCGTTLDGLFEGLPERAKWQRAEDFIAWDDWRTLVERLAGRVGSDEKLREAARRAVTPHQLGPLATLFPDVLSLYEFFARWAGPALYPCMRFSFRRGDGGVGTYAVELAPGLEPCRPWFVLTGGSLASVPLLVGLQEADVVELSCTERSGSWLISSLGAQWERMKTPPPGARVIINQLYTQQDALARALEERRASEAELARMIDALPLLACLQTDGVVRSCNEAFAGFFGRPRKALSGVPLAALFPASEQGRLESLLAAPQGEHTHLFARVGEGVRTLSAQRGPALTVGGVTGTLLVARDVSAEREAERRATSSEETLTAVLNALPDLVMRFDPGARLQAVFGGDPNVRALTAGVIGLTIEQIQAKWGNAATPEGTGMRVGVHQALATGQPSTDVISWRGPAGVEHQYVLRFVPMGADVLVLAHDRTTELERERRMHASERMASLGELAAGVAHEINNPLTGLLGSLAALRTNLGQGGPREEALALLDELREASERIRDTAARMRDFSLVKAPSRQVVRLLDVARRADRMTRTELRYRARLELEVDPAVRVVGDADELVEVLVNLLANAAQAMPPGAGPETHRVVVRARAEGDAAVLEVIDDGMGIPRESLPRIFDPYFTTRERRAGAGFGLPICHRIVTAHGGTIAARSEPGHTVLTVQLPLAREPAGPAPSAEPGRRARVLVIDDEPAVGRAITRALPRHEVEVAADARQGFARLREGELPDLVLVDLMMPAFTGMELYAALKHVRPEVLPRLVFITGGTFTEAAADFLKDVPVMVLTKPFVEGELEAQLQRVLAQGGSSPPLDPGLG